jgi:hypothetical protein
MKDRQVKQGLLRDGYQWEEEDRRRGCKKGEYGGILCTHE